MKPSHELQIAEREQRVGNSLVRENAPVRGGRRSGFPHGYAAVPIGANRQADFCNKTSGVTVLAMRLAK